MKVDFLIIGGGVIGLSSAFELARSGARVTVLERSSCGQESSWAGGGILSTLLPWDYPPAVTNLTQLGCEMYPEWVRQVAEISGIDPEYRRSGLLAIDAVDGARAMAWGRAHDVRVDYLPHCGDVQQELGIDKSALWLPGVAQVRNPRLMKSLREALVRIGVDFVEHAEVDEIGAVAGGVSGVRAAGTDYRAERYVLAAGAWSKNLLGRLGEPIDVKPIRGQMLLFKTPPGLLKQIVLYKGIYLIPRDDGHLLVGSTLEDVGFDKSITEKAAQALHAQAAEILPWLRTASPIRHWAGLRPGSPGNIPYIGRHPAIENLYLNTGHFRYGVTMAPASAHILANLVSDSPQPCDIFPYQPE